MILNRVLIAVALLAVPLALPACGGPQEVADPGTHLPPFDSGALRAGLPAGTGWVFQHTDDAGETWYETTEVTRATDASVVMRQRRETIDGEPIGEPESMEATWPQLVSHATHSRGNTTRSTVPVELALGEFEGIRFITVEDDGTTTEATFVRDFPGPPVRWIQRQGDTVLYQMELVARWEPMDAP